LHCSFTAAGGIAGEKHSHVHYWKVVVEYTIPLDKDK